MIKKKDEFKIISSSRLEGMGRAISRAALTGWWPVSPMTHESHQSLEILMHRNVAVNKDNITNMILLDFKDLIGSVAVEPRHNRRSAIQDSEKVDDFILEMNELYKCGGTLVRDIILNNLEKTTWINDE